MGKIINITDKENKKATKKRITFFRSNSAYGLTEQINEFMAKYKPEDIIDVSTQISNKLDRSYNNYSLDQIFYAFITYLEEVGK